MAATHEKAEQIVDVTIEAVRDRFHTLNVPLAFFDGPGGTQVPDSVIEAISGYLLAANANAGGKFLTSLVTDDVDRLGPRGRLRPARRATDEVTFGANMTTLNFALSRTASRDWQAGDEVVVHAARPRREHLALARARPRQGLVVKLRRARRRVPDRPRPPALAAHRADEGGRVPAGLERGRHGHAGRGDRRRSRTRRARSPGSTPCTTRPHGDIEVAELGCDVLLCSPYKFYGPHLGLAWVRRELLESWRPYKVRPASDAPGPAARDGDARRTSCSAASSRASSTCTASAGSSSPSTSASSGSGSSTGCPTAGRCTGRRRWRAASRPSRLAAGRDARTTPRPRLGAAGFAVWHGNYYAVEVMKHLGLADGAVRVGIVHTNMEDEVDRLLAALPQQ